MIDTDRYDNEGIELTDGGTICFPEDDGRIQRIDKDGNIMQTLHPEDTEWQEWYELFDTHKDLLAEVKRLKIYERLVLCIAYHQQLPDGLYVDEELMLRAREHLRKNGEWEGEEE